MAVILARLTAHREAGLSARRPATLSDVISWQRQRARHVSATARPLIARRAQDSARRLALRVREDRGGFKAAVGSSRRDPDTRVPPGIFRVAAARAVHAVRGTVDAGGGDVLGVSQPMA